MHKEKLQLSPIENELLFKEWLRRNRVEMILFDGDDTLWGTVPLFVRFMNECYDFLAASAPILSRTQWKELIEATENRLFESHGVNPNKWAYVLEKVDQNLRLPVDIKNRAADILAQVYITPPEFLPGTEEGLKFLRQSGIPMGIVTHANADWTRRKFHWLGLSRFIDWDDVFVIDENGHKTPDSWKQALNYFHRLPELCAVVGDSPRSDINPCRALGVRHCFLLNGGPKWSIHNQPVAPDTKTISSITELIQLGNECLP